MPVFSRAGMPAQAAPASMPAIRAAGRSRGAGMKSAAKSATPVAATPPAVSWPSAPMFQNLSLNASATPSPVSMRGIAFTRVSEKAIFDPNAPLNIAAKVAKGSASNIASTIPVRTRAARKETAGTATSAAAENDFRFSNTTLMV